MKIQKVIILLVIMLSLVSARSRYRSRRNKRMDFHVLPAMPVGFGVNAYDGRGGFHFNGRIGPYISFGSDYTNEFAVFSVLPTIGYVENRFYKGREHFLTLGANISLQLLDIRRNDGVPTFSFGAEMVTKSFNDKKRGVRYNAKVGFWDLVFAEVAFQDFESKRVQLALNFDPVLFLAKVTSDRLW